LAIIVHLDNLCVVLVATRNPLNIGAAARAMSNFGVARLRVVNPYEASFREARSAVGASELLKNAEVFTSVADAVSDCALVIGTTAARDRELQHPLRDVAQGAPLVRKALASGKVALLFGSEKRGLSNEDLSHCHWLMHIATRAEHLSMNLGQSVAICLYEIVRNVAKGRVVAKKAASAKELERLTTVLLEALTSSGYVKRGASAVTEDKLRRLIRRLSFSSEDAELLLGMLRKVTWKLNAKG
jgi:tRNA/rRNA methyltransferase